MTESDNKELKKENDEEALGSGRRRSLMTEFKDYLIENKKYWMIPIIMVIALLVLLMIFAATGSAPFIYALF
jgi:hypothetical protein